MGPWVIEAQPCLRQVIERFGCLTAGDVLSLNVPEFCPVRCRSPECAYQCDRHWDEGGEVPNPQNQRRG